MAEYLTNFKRVNHTPAEPISLFTPISEEIKTASDSLVRLVLRRNRVDKRRTSFSSNVEEELFTFIYSIRLVSDYISDYSFELLTLGYNIDYYPVGISLNEGIAKELNLFSNASEFEVRTFSKESDLKSVLKTVFGTEYFKTILSNMMNMAENRMSGNDLDGGRSFW